MQIKYFILILIPVVFFSISGCDSDLSLTSTKPNMQHPSEAVMTGLLTTAYSTLTIDRSTYGYGLWGSINGCDTDESFFKNTNITGEEATSTMGLHNCSSTTVPIQELWRAMYEIIESSNIVIGMSKSVQMDEAKKADMVGQAMSLRAFAHFMLAVHFGPVPIKNTPTDQMTNLDLPRNSMKEVCSFAVKELRNAVPQLKEITETQTTTYITKTVAEGLSLRVGLFMASHEAIKDSTMYDSVAVWGKQLIERSVRNNIHALNTSSFLFKGLDIPGYAVVFISNMMNDVNYAHDKEAMWDCSFYMKSSLSGPYQGWNNSYVNNLGSYMGVDCLDLGFGSSTIGYADGKFRPHATLWAKYEKGDLRRDWNISPYVYKNTNNTRYNYISYTLPNLMGTPSVPAKLLFVVKGDKLVDETVIENGGAGYTDGTYASVKVEGYSNVWASGSVTTNTGSGTLFTITVSGGAITSVKMTGTSASGYMNVFSRGIGKWRREFENIPSVMATSREKYNTSCNFPILRYADVLLMTAEAALFKKGTQGASIIPDGLGYVNQVRKRAGLTSISSYDLPYIQDERSRELCFEGVRRMDLIRWGQNKYSTVYNQIMNDAKVYGSDGTNSSTAYKNDAAINSAGNNDPKPVYSMKALMGYYTKYSLLPIPNNELGRASNTFYQNPGW
ncbi:MAG: RagB/SusD family nutrient uptake outer membrane protein [Paludibacter sp.]